MLEHLVDLTAYAASVIESTDMLELVAQPTSVMCVFDAPGAIPDDLRRVQQRLLLRGEMVIGRTEIHGRVALKFTFVNPLTIDQDVDRLINMVTAEFAVLSR
jgi:L-2,4-diaminobutyrate decarboxylase